MKSVDDWPEATRVDSLVIDTRESSGGVGFAILLLERQKLTD